MTKRSVVMDGFYGQEISRQIFDRLAFIDTQFNEEMQRAYDHYWAMPGLSLKEKSVVALTSLVALKKAEQTKLQFMGFLNAGGTIEEALDLLCHLGKELNDPLKMHGFKMLENALREKGTSPELLAEVALKFAGLLKNPLPTPVLAQSLVDKMRITLAIVSEDDIRMEAVFSAYLLHDPQQLEIIRWVLIQLIVYCGFPMVMNGFSALRKVLVSYV